MRLILIALLLVGCGIDLDNKKDADTPKVQFLRTEIRDILDEYMADADKYGIPKGAVIHSITYEDIEPGILAYCLSSESRGQRIKLSRPLETADHAFLRAVLYHELSHCKYDTPHLTEVNDEIMSAGMHNEPGIWTVDWDKKVERLFNHIKKELN